MKKQWMFSLLGIVSLAVLLSVVFKPQVSKAIEDQYVLWHLDRLDADRYKVTTLPTVYHVLLNRDSERFVFFYRGASDISERVSIANEFLSSWPENESKCENKLPGQEACLIAGSSEVLGQ